MTSEDLMTRHDQGMRKVEVNTARTLQSKQIAKQLVVQI